MTDDNLKKDEVQNTGPSEVISHESLLKLQKERDEYLAGWQRAKADFINYKKDEMKRIEEMLHYAQEDLLLDLINILDSFDLALMAMENNKVAPTSAGEDGVGVPTPKAVGIEKGVYMIRAQIEDKLKKRGVEKIPIKLGEPYNPTLAEILAEVESDQAPGSIVEEIEPGYRLGEKIIRPARVKVAKSK